MADYKRMVSYMYLYENGVKKKNVGYARVEVKNGECKITLHMQLLGLLDSIFPTYLIQRQEEDTELVYLGDSALKNQIMDSRLTANELNIMESGYKLSDMGGILLFLNDSVFFATEWDDKPVLLKDVMEALKPKQKVKKPFVEPQKLPEEIPPAPDNHILSDLKQPDTSSEDKAKQDGAYRDIVSDGKTNPTDQLKAEQTNTEKSFPDPNKGKQLIENPPFSCETCNRISAEEKTEKKRSDNVRPVKTAPKEEFPEVETSKKTRKSLDEEDLFKQGQGDEKDLQKDLTDSTQQDQSLFDHVFLPEDNDPDKAGIKANIPEAVMQDHMWDYNHMNEMDEAGIPLYQMPRGWKTVEGFQKPQTLRQIVNPWDTLQRFEGSQTAQPQQPVNEKANQRINSSPYDQKAYEKVNPADQMDNKILQKDIDEKENPVAVKIFDSFPRIYPFEDNEIMLCVKISPKDIGLLPADIWAFSNNSFLLHGYYCYNHMIFAKIKDRLGCRYILGVPGIFHNRERFMARMFGFECFKSIRKRELRQGDFGYWYIPVCM